MTAPLWIAAVIYLLGYVASYRYFVTGLTDYFLGDFGLAVYYAIFWTLLWPLFAAAVAISWLFGKHEDRLMRLLLIRQRGGAIRRDRGR